MKGILQLVLHGHLPYINHPDYNNFYEETWFFEAITEVYLPILQKFYKLEKENINFRITISLSPPLIEMFEDKILINKYNNYLNDLIKIAEFESETSKRQKERELACYYLNNLKSLKDLFSDKLSRNILQGFKEFQEKGNIQMIICNGTHNFLPAFKDKDYFINSSINISKYFYNNKFKGSLKGIWLAEMGYFDGLDKQLKASKIDFTFLNFNSINNNNYYSPMKTENNLIFYVRDPQTNDKIWDANIGYPGNKYYREFYSDISFEKNNKILNNFNDKYGVNTSTGIKYKAITNKNVSTEKKQYYNPKKAKFQIKSDVINFLKDKNVQVNKLCENNYDFIPVLTAPFDMELFGHWWYEGPDFLYELLKSVDESNFLETDYHESIKNRTKIVNQNPKMSSWGDKGFSNTWVDKSNIWIYPFIETAYKSLVHYKNSELSDLENRIYSQMLREFFLLVSSDWYFLIYNNSSKDYSEMRVKNHIANFFALDKMLINSKSIKNIKVLEDLEKINSIFSFIDKDFIFQYQNSF
ncbi:MAG: 1,4-alpha-glucan branching protein domain-containing protein [Thermotogota bacterium]